MPIKSINAAETVLGYTLKEQIGIGGYGEVWSAEAPGGFSKAIKFIHGYHDENRAQRELKALQRVKEVESHQPVLNPPGDYVIPSHSLAVLIQRGMPRGKV